MWPQTHEKPKLGRLGKSWLVIISITPVVIVTSYELYQRLVNGKEQRVLGPNDKFNIIRQPHVPKKDEGKQNDE